jgi:Flp pilus assembly pilin Flp
MRAFLTRCYKDQRGAHIVEMSLAIGLFALIAAFGYFAFGDALTDYYNTLSIEFGNGVSFIGTP